MRIASACLSLAVLVLSGCANYLYVGEFVTPDSAGQARTVQVYWPRTTKLIGPDKAGPVVVRIACGIPLEYAEQPEGIVFRGNPMDDAPLDAGQVVSASEIFCGEIRGIRRIADLRDGTVSFTVLCRPLSDDFSALVRTYPVARPDPYRVEVRSTVQRSLFGSTREVPPPACEPAG